MGIFDNIVFDEFTLLEGKQAEKYLEKKQKEKEAKKKEDEKRYGSNYRKYDYYNEKNYRDGTRSQRTKVDYNGEERDYSRDGEWSYDKYDKNPSMNNPRFDKARELEEHRKKYSDVMPSKKTKIEKEYEKAKAKDVAAKEYADKVAHHLLSKERQAVGGRKYELETPEYARAADAARRHYRRTHKNESAFEDIEMI